MQERGFHDSFTPALQVFQEFETDLFDASERERSFEMIIDGKFTLQAPIQKVWDSLLDPQTLGTCVPGTEMMEAIDKETYESIVAQRVGPFKVKLKFTTKLTEVRPPNYIKAVGRGADVTKLGNFSTEIEVNLNETSPDNVEVSYTANVSLVGRLATFGERIMRAKSKDVGEQFTKNLQEKLKG
jgi:carbon monoxide dehydrogenase subunit G